MQGWSVSGKGCLVIELARVIGDLREEPERAMVAGAGEALRFELGPVELKVSVAVERSDNGGGKARFWVVEIGGERAKDTTGTQRIKLVLTPCVGESGQSAYDGGPAEPGES
jgi:Trypsin-co-occurring domain 2